MFADTGALCTRGFVLSVDVVVRSVTEVAFSEQLIIRVSSLGVDVLGLSVEDDVSDGLLRGVEKEPNSTSVCVPKSPVGGGGGGGGGGALDLQCRQCPYFFRHLFNKMRITAMVVATAQVRNPIDVKKIYIHIYTHTHTNKKTSELFMFFFPFLVLLFLDSI